MSTADSIAPRSASEEREIPFKPLSVVVVNDFAHVNGGAAQVAISSAIALAALGHQVTFFAAVPPVSPLLASAGIQVVLTGQLDIKADHNRLRAATQGIWNPKAAAELSRVLEGLDKTNTVVHVHGWTKALTSSVVRLAIRCGVPVVVTLHDYFYACPNGGFYDFQAKATCPLRPLSAACICRNCDRDGYPQKLWRTARQFVQNEFGFPDSNLLHFITISDLSETVIRDYLPKSTKVYRVPNPADALPGDCIPVQDNREFVAIGRLSPEKGYALLSGAARTANVPVTFIGEGPSRADIAALNPNAQITGWLDRDAVRARLSAARCLVFPSVWYEAQPLVIGEAAAMGIPAVVSDACAGREQIEDGESGLLFRSGDAHDLAQKLKRLAEDHDLAARLGREAYDRYWRNPPTLEKHAAKLDECYRDVLRSARQR